MFQIKYQDGSAADWPLGKILCVGRNYADHAKELNNDVPSKPMIFIKPATAAVPMEQPFSIPAGRGTVHHELELALLIGKPLVRATEQHALDAVAGLGMALDLTLRDMQDELKSKGHPWELAKAFDGSCPLSAFAPIQGLDDDYSFSFRLDRNGKLQQHGRTGDMIFRIPMLLAFMSQHFSLMPGDVVLTGTPAGVGPLAPGDALTVELEEFFHLQTSVK